jgi:acyl-CoA dehydrogenase-like protein
MDLALPEAAAAFAAATEQAVTAMGGVDVARRAEVDPSIRTTEVLVVLERLGVPDIDPRADIESAAVAGELCRVAGRHVLPFPIVGYVMARPGEGTPAVLGSAPPLRAEHGDLFDQWLVHDLSGDVYVASSSSPPIGARLAPFTTDLVRKGAAPRADGDDVQYLYLLWAYYLLGVTEQALELAIAHVKDRVQFGRPLAAMQSVQFQVADATVAVDGLRELARFTLWRVASDPRTALADALAARLQALDAAHSVLRLAQQLHGASGLCDEYDISILVRHVQTALRLPVDSGAMSEMFFDATRTSGFESLFSLGADGGGAGSMLGGR